MSTVDLMLLGVLMQKPMNAYEMKKEMEYRDIQQWIRISSPSVYKNLVKLYKLGYINGKTIREGEMPEKTIYSINDKGKKYFMRLMEHYSSAPGKIDIDFCAFIANLHHLDPETGLKMVNRLQETLSFKLEEVNDHLKRRENISFYATAIISLYSRMYSVLNDWIRDFKARYNGQPETG